MEFERDYEVVLVNYRSRHHVEELLSQWPRDVPVVVVDNSANSDGICDCIAGYPNVRYVDGKGQGFARAANLGAFSSSRPFVVFVNPDSRPRVDALDGLVDGLRVDHGALAHAATALGKEGNPEVGVGGWEPTVTRAFVHAFGLHKVFRRAGLFAWPRLGEHVEVDWTTGACMAIDRARFVRMGGFDEMFYVYLEDVSLGRKARAQRLREVLREDITVPHGAGRSGAPSREMLRLRGASYAYYLSTYHHPARAAGIMTVMALGYLIRAGVSRPRSPQVAQGYLAFVTGMLTRSAKVGGTEVARARYLEVAGAPT